MNNKKINILTIGYPKIESPKNIVLKSLETIYEDINFNDYHIILIKDPVAFINKPNIISQIGSYKGILSLGLWPFNYYKGEDDEFYKIDLYASKENDNTAKLKNIGKEYTRVLDYYLETSLEMGYSIEFNESHWLGKILNKYSGYFVYNCVVETSNNENMHNLFESLSRLSQKKRRKPFMEVFAYNPGKKRIGVIKRVGNTALILHPLFKKEIKSEKLSEILQVLILSFAKKFYKTKNDNVNNPPAWVKNNITIIKPLEEEILNKFYFKNNLKKLLWGTGEELENATENVLKFLGFDVLNITKEGNQGDLMLTINGTEYIIEIKGIDKAADKGIVSKFITDNHFKNLILIVNHYRTKDINERLNNIKEYPPYSEHALKIIKGSLKNQAIKEFYPTTTIELVKTAMNIYNSNKNIIFDNHKKMQEQNNKILIEHLNKLAEQRLQDI